MIFILSLVISNNIGKNTLTSNDNALNDYITCFEGLYPHVDYIVVNVSCPNVTDLHKLQDQDALELILHTLDLLRSKKELRKPILMKISPDLNNNQIDETIVKYSKELNNVRLTDTWKKLRTELSKPCSQLTWLDDIYHKIILV